MDWIKLAHNTDKWPVLVNMAMNLRVAQNKQHAILTYSLFVTVSNLICQYRLAPCEISGFCHGVAE
jgi:hypothetical protein